MRQTVVFTSNLPAAILKQLDDVSRKFGIPKNKIIEKALLAYFERIKKAAYTHSFRRAACEQNQISLAEDGLEDYLKILDE